MYNPATRLPVYEDTIRFGLSLDDFVEQLPSYRRYIGVQLRRAVLSILLNLTEGATESEPREKARMYRLARRSAAECAAALDFAGRVMPDLKQTAQALERQALDLFTQLQRLGGSLAPTQRGHLRRGGKPRG